MLPSRPQPVSFGRRSVQHGNARDLTGDGGFSVCGLAIERFPAIAPAEPATFAVIAVVSRPTRLYTFIGGPTLNQLFTKYNNDRRNEAFDEIPSDLQYAELHLFTKYLLRALHQQHLDALGLVRLDGRAASARKIAASAPSCRVRTARTSAGAERLALERALVQKGQFGLNKLNLEGHFALPQKANSNAF